MVFPKRFFGLFGLFFAFTCVWQRLEQSVTELSRVLAPTLGSWCTLVLPKTVSLRENMYKVEVEIMTPVSQC